MCINCSMAECFPEKSNWYRNEQACQEVKCKAQLSNGQDIVCKNITLTLLQMFRGSNLPASVCGGGSCPRSASVPRDSCVCTRCSGAEHEGRRPRPGPVVGYTSRGGLQRRTCWEPAGKSSFSAPL